MHYILFYTFTDDYLQRRAQFRVEHLRLAWEAHDRGEIVVAGALAEPADTGVLLFKGESPLAAEQFAASDPYVTHGLVKHWEVRPWTTVVGVDAATPFRPV